MKNLESRKTIKNINVFLKNVKTIFKNLKAEQKAKNKIFSEKKKKKKKKENTRGRKYICIQN